YRDGRGTLEVERATLDVRGRSRPDARLELTARVRGTAPDQVAVDALKATGSGVTLTASGGTSLVPDAALNGALAVDADLAAALPELAAKGRLEARLGIAGTLSAPTVSYDLAATGLEPV